MSAGLEGTHTLPELREWLKVRVRWLRDWQMATKNPKPIPPPFLDAILSLYGDSRCPPPSDPAKLREWANQWIEKYSINTIHQVHDWLEIQDVFAPPDWHGRDDPRILIEALEHLSALLNFVGVRVSERSEPAGQAEGEQAGSDPAEGERTEGTDEHAQQNAIATLSPAIRLAYLSFEAALVMAEKKTMKDREAHNLLGENGIPEDSQGELTDYELPSFGTWARQLRAARNAVGEQNRTRRRGRQHGKSVVRQDQIEPPDNDR